MLLVMPLKMKVKASINITCKIIVESLAKILNHMYRYHVLFPSEDYSYYPSAMEDTYNDIKQTLCYLVKKNYDICYGRLEPFAAEAVGRKIKNDDFRISTKNKINILCLDGGGVRGIMEAVILKEIEKRTGKKAK